MNSTPIIGDFPTTAGLQEIFGQQMRTLPSRSDEISQLVHPELALLRTA